MPEARTVAARVFVGAADVEAVGGATRIGQPVGEHARIDALRMRAAGQCRGAFARRVQVAERHVLVRAPLALRERQARERPSDRAVAQRDDGIGHAGVDQRLRADQAARAAGAVDDDEGRRVRREVTGAAHQFAAGHADRAGQAHAAVFVEAPGIEQDELVAAREATLEFVGRDRRRVAPGLDQLAEGLARHVDVAEQLETGFAPGAQSTGEQRDVGVAQRLQLARRHRRHAFPVVVDDDGHAAPRQAPPGVELQPRGGEVGGPQRMGLGIGRFLAHVEQRDLHPREQRGADVGDRASRQRRRMAGRLRRVQYLRGRGCGRRAGRSGRSGCGVGRGRGDRVGGMQDGHGGGLLAVGRSGGPVRRGARPAIPGWRRGEAGSARR